MISALIGFIIVLGVIVLVHELGHFFTARLFGAKVEEFGLGFPPRLVGVYKDESDKKKIVWGSKFEAEKAPTTVYSLNKIPIGGFVRIKGENGEGETESDSFAAKKAWQKSIILSAGVIGNLVLAFILFSVGFWQGTVELVDDNLPAKARSIESEAVQVVSVSMNSPAETAGFRRYDVLKSLDGQEFVQIENIQEYTDTRSGQMMTAEIKRGNKEMSLEIIPRILETSNNKAVMGVGLAKTITVSYKWYAAIWKGLQYTGMLTVAISVAFFDIIKSLLTGGQLSVEVTGPVGIAEMAGNSLKLGWLYLLQFTAILSINLAIINILPFPALDGGRLLFVLIEKIRGKKNNQKVEGIVHTVGFALLMLLFVLVTYKDVVRIGGQVIEKII